jgi:beta-1,4-mannooligosaccharide/beta-1,4-mannosyl-N-acetylglucosamine phosphorylase
MCFAIDTFYGVRGGIAVTDDLENFEVLSITVPDNRNMVLFPEKINGNFVRLERPFPVYGRQGEEAFDIWLSESPDAKFWGEHRIVLGAESVPYSSCKIGPAAPPVRTDAGWLTTIHAVERDDDKELYTWEKEWHKVYYAGIMLLDLEDPSKVIGFSKEPLLSPEEKYELEGFRGSVIFPGGMILEDSGEVKIYYGAADSVECLATAHVDDLIKMCIN